MRESIAVLSEVENASTALGPVERMRAALGTLLDDALKLSSAIEVEVGATREQVLVRTQLDQAALWLAAATPDIRRRSAGTPTLRSGFPSLWSIDLSRL